MPRSSLRCGDDISFHTLGPSCGLLFQRVWQDRQFDLDTKRCNFSVGTDMFAMGYRDWSAPLPRLSFAARLLHNSLMTKCLSEGLTKGDRRITLGPGTRLPEVTAQGCSKTEGLKRVTVWFSRVSLLFCSREMTSVMSSARAERPSGPEGASAPREAHTSL